MADVGDKAVDRLCEAGRPFEAARGALSSGSVNRVAHGANEFSQDLSGWTVGQVKHVYRDVLNCPYFAEAFIDGVSATVSASLKPGQHLEFLQRFGFKSGRKVPRFIHEARGLLNGYPEFTRIVRDMLDRAPTVDESDIMAVILYLSSEKFGKPTQEAIPALEEMVRGLIRHITNLKACRIINASLTDSDRAIVEVVRVAGRRLTTKLLLSDLSKGEIPLSDSTAKGRLADLTRRGILSKCSRCRPRGYGLPEWSHSCGLDSVRTD